MSEGLDTREAIRLALQYAIQDRLAYIDSINGASMDDVVADTRAEIKAWRKILKRRYGSHRTDGEKAFDGTVLVDIRDLKAPPNGR